MTGISATVTKKRRGRPRAVSWDADLAMSPSEDRACATMPLNAPDPHEWLGLDEQERIDEVVAYHRRNHLPMGGSANLHGISHIVVENQIAMGDPGRPADARAERCALGQQLHAGANQ
jgi:hypothetical protein